MIRRQSTNSNIEVVHIRSERIVEWMGQNKVLSVALEGNIDQVQYTDKIKGIVEFLGVRLNLEELTRMWSLQVSWMSNKLVRKLVLQYTDYIMQL